MTKNVELCVELVIKLKNKYFYCFWCGSGNIHRLLYQTYTPYSKFRRAFLYLLQPYITELETVSQTFREVLFAIDKLSGIHLMV